MSKTILYGNGIILFIFLLILFQMRNTKASSIGMDI